MMLKGRSEQADALRYLKRAVDLDPNRAEFHVYLAWAANDAQPAKLELARDEIDKALALDKLNPEAYWQKGVLERMEGAIDDAIKDERHALALRPSRYEAHATLAECYEDKNDHATGARRSGRRPSRATATRRRPTATVPAPVLALPLRQAADGSRQRGRRARAAAARGAGRGEDRTSAPAGWARWSF